MASLKKDIFANLFGKIWSALITILLVPFYVNILGIESYGLIGFYATLISAISLLDFGLSTTLNRELASRPTAGADHMQARNLTFSLEVVYWIVGITIAIILTVASPIIVKYWVNNEHLSFATVNQSIKYMGLIIAFQWPISLYTGGLRGLHKQVLNNHILVIISTIKAVGVLLVLKYISPTVQAFFLWQAGVTFLHVICMRVNLWRHLPGESSGKFSRAQLKKVWRFAAGMTGIGLVTFFIAEIDKILLTKILPLSEFGYYSLAFTVASSLGLVVGPISYTFFPRFSSLVSEQKEEALVLIYHKACKLVATLIFPICFVLFFFMPDVLMVWTRSEQTVMNTSLLARILIIGSTLNALMLMPYNLLIANGMTKFTFYQNLIAAIILVPLLLVLTVNYGGTGAAIVWCILNLGYVFISQPVMHKRILKQELKNWYIGDVLRPLIPSLLTAMLLKSILSFGFPAFGHSVFSLAIIGSVVMAISLVSMPGVIDTLKNLRKFSAR